MITSRDLHFFSILASSPSLAAAARALDVTAPAVTQRLQALEQRLGVQLVDRSSHRYHLTAKVLYWRRKGPMCLIRLKELQPYSPNVEMRLSVHCGYWPRWDLGELMWLKPWHACVDSFRRFNLH
nr:LysR family transcriptional regulator [Dickeya oryzae]